MLGKRIRDFVESENQGSSTKKTRHAKSGSFPSKQKEPLLEDDFFDDLEDNISDDFDYAENINPRQANKSKLTGKSINNSRFEPEEDSWDEQPRFDVEEEEEEGNQNQKYQKTITSKKTNTFKKTSSNKKAPSQKKKPTGKNSKRPSQRNTQKKSREPSRRTKRDQPNERTERNQLNGRTITAQQFQQLISRKIPQRPMRSENEESDGDSQEEYGDQNTYGNHSGSNFGSSQQEEYNQEDYLDEENGRDEDEDENEEKETSTTCPEFDDVNIRLGVLKEGEVECFGCSHGRTGQVNSSVEDWNNLFMLFTTHLQFSSIPDLCLSIHTYYETYIRNTKTRRISPTRISSEWSPRMIYEHFFNHINHPGVVNEISRMRLVYMIRKYQQDNLWVKRKGIVTITTDHSRIQTFIKLNMLLLRMEKSKGLIEHTVQLKPYKVNGMVADPNSLKTLYDTTGF